MGDFISDFFRSLGIAEREAPTDPLQSRVFRRAGQDDATYYGRFAYKSEASIGPVPRAQYFEAVGDHLLLDELVGSEAVYVKLGEWGNPWVRLEEGDTLRRRFIRVWVTVAASPDISNISRAQVEATFLHSWGPLKKKGGKSYGYRRGFKAFRGTATTSEESAFKPLVDFCPGVALVFGKRGGRLNIRNRDRTNTLFVRFGVKGVVGSEDLWELYPGECQTFPLEQRIHSSSDTVLVSCAAGTCAYGVLTSAFDIDRADLNQTSMAGI